MQALTDDDESSINCRLGLSECPLDALGSQRCRQMGSAWELCIYKYT